MIEGDLIAILVILEIMLVTWMEIMGISSLVCKNCGLNGHNIEMCFEIIG
jgi:hypothetical protein